MTHFTCRQCDCISYPHYFKKRDGSEWFGEFKCSNCGYVEPPALGVLKVRKDKRLP